MKEYFKICRIADDRYFSMNVPFDYIPNMCIEYKLNEWVQPKLQGSRLFAYRSFDVAILNFSFLKQYISSIKYALFKCRIKNPVLINTNAFSASTIMETWKYFPQYRKIPIKNRNANCVVVTEIMLIERIQ